MNSIIKKELDKVSIIKLQYDGATTHLVIPKVTKLSASAMQINKVYEIELTDSVVRPPENSTLAANWNNGKVPKYSKYCAEVVDKVANMVKINATAIENPSYSFFGWVPCDGIKTVTNIA